jgi:transcriptional regulator of acetoin/glycerol metabolism
LLSFEKQIKRARIVLESKGNAPSAFLNSKIHESWNRCLDFGLDPTGQPDQKIISRSELEKIKDKNNVISRLAHAEIKNLYMQISGSNFAILFANQEGIVLESVCDKSFSNVADTSYLTPGFVWKESVNGTNALGCALNSRHPVTVHAGEHFFRTFGELTCVAAPVFDPDGNLVGAMDASSNCHQRQHHTHAHIKMSCITIENGLFKNMLSNKIVLEMHNRPEFLGTLQVGLMAFDEQGFLLNGNRVVRYLFQDAFIKPGMHFDGIFKCRFDEFLDSCKRNHLVHLQDIHESSFAVRTFVPDSIFGTPIFLSQQLSLQDKKIHTTPRMVYSDPDMKSVVNDVEKAIHFRAPIHIYGETGTGKEILSRHIHTISKVRGKFVAVSCANLTESLAESELFGYQNGAFTGAEKGGSPGLILQADGGTLFLDEIGDMPLSLQATLLRFLDDWHVRPVGGTIEQKVDINLITATNRNLKIAVDEKKFREDLWFRINTMEVHIPPLRERRDFSEIVESILKKFEPLLKLEKEAIEELQGEAWPGNIRQLKSFLLRLHIKSTDRLVTGKQMKEWLGNANKIPGGKPPPNGFREHQQDIIQQTYEQLGGNVSAVARKLRISRNTVYKNLKIKMDNCFFCQKKHKKTITAEMCTKPGTDTTCTCARSF